MSPSPRGADEVSSRGVGGRIGTILFAFAIGAVYGAVATIGHRATLRIGEVAIPWGLVAALVGVTALLLGIRLLVRGRATTAAAAAGVVVSSRCSRCRAPADPCSSSATSRARSGASPPR